MSDVISRGSCPRLPVNLTRATKAVLIDEMQRALAELAEARSLLAAIAELAVVPGPSSDYHDDPGEYERAQNAWHNAQRDRVISIHVAAAAESGWSISEKVLRMSAAEDLGYVPRPNVNGFGCAG